MRWPAVISLPKKILCPLLALTLGGAPAAQDSLSADRYRMEIGQPPVRVLRLVDVNGDGFTDLFIHIDTQSMELVEGETTAGIGGTTYDGARIEGFDTLNIVPQ